MSAAQREASRFESLLSELRDEHLRVLGLSEHVAPPVPGSRNPPPPLQSSPELPLEGARSVSHTKDSEVSRQQSGDSQPLGSFGMVQFAPLPGSIPLEKGPMQDQPLQLAVVPVDTHEVQDSSEKGIPRKCSDEDENHLTAGRHTQLGTIGAPTSVFNQIFDTPAEGTDVWGKNVGTTRTGLAKIVTSGAFECVLAVLIFINTLCIAAEAQYAGIESGHKFDLGFPYPVAPADEAMPGTKDVLYVLDWFFGVVFTMEILLKIVAIPKDVVTDYWNVIDFSIVVFFWIGAASTSGLPLNPKLVRMARLARLLRFLRVVKTIQAFDALNLMTTSIAASFSALAWSSVVLLMGEMMLALLLNLMLQDFWEQTAIENPHITDEQRKVIYAYFGTFSKALLTMIEMLLGNWFHITRLLSEWVSEWYMLFGLCHQLVVGFAVINVITGVFLQETFKVAEMDDGIMTNEIRRRRREEQKKMDKFFEEADSDGSGLLDKDEFRTVLSNPAVIEWLEAQGLDLQDVDMVFDLIDKDGDGVISCSELVDGAGQLRGPARAMDIAVMNTMLQKMLPNGNAPPPRSHDNATIKAIKAAKMSMSSKKSGRSSVGSVGTKISGGGLMFLSSPSLRSSR